MQRQATIFVWLLHQLPHRASHVKWQINRGIPRNSPQTLLIGTDDSALVMEDATPPRTWQRGSERWCFFRLTDSIVAARKWTVHFPPCSQESMLVLITSNFHCEMQMWLVKLRAGEAQKGRRPFFDSRHHRNAWQLAQFTHGAVIRNQDFKLRETDKVPCHFHGILSAFLGRCAQYLPTLEHPRLGRLSLSIPSILQQCLGRSPSESLM